MSVLCSSREVCNAMRYTFTVHSFLNYMFKLFPHERLQIKFPLCFTAFFVIYSFLIFSWILEADMSHCWHVQLKNPRCVTNMPTGLQSCIVTEQQFSRIVTFEMVNKRNVFAAAEYTILIKHPNAVNLFYKAGNREHVKGQWVFIHCATIGNNIYFRPHRHRYRMHPLQL